MMDKVRYFLLLGVVTLFLSCENEGNVLDSPWKYSDPSTHQVSAQSLLELDLEIEKGTYGKIKSLIILRNNDVIFENYYNGTKRDDLQPLNGATMSITSAVAGIAIEESGELDLNDLVIDYFPEYSVHFDDIPQKDKIEFVHLLNHRSGLWWDEEGLSFFHEDNEARQMLEEDNWLDFVLRHQMIRVPGQNFNYNSGNAVVAGAMIEKAVEKPILDYTNEKLFNPLSIEEWEWSSDTNGVANTAFGLELRTCDLAKIGHLFLNDGYWNDENIITKEWIESSTDSDVPLASYHFGKYWWRLSFNHYLSERLATNDLFFAWGEGGQFLFVIPHLQMVVVTTAENYSGNTELYAFQFMAEHILSAISSPTSIK